MLKKPRIVVERLFLRERFRGLPINLWVNNAIVPRWFKVWRS